MRSPFLILLNIQGFYMDFEGLEGALAISGAAGGIEAACCPCAPPHVA